MKKDLHEYLEMDLTKSKDEDLLNDVVSKLLAIHEIDKEYKLSLEEDTAYYIFVILRSLAEGGYYTYLQTAYSEKTDEAFDVMKAKKYGKLFKEYNTTVINELRAVKKGLFNKSKQRKIMISYTKKFKDEWEKLDSEKPLVPNYVVPFLKEKVLPKLNAYKVKAE